MNEDLPDTTEWEKELSKKKNSDGIQFGAEDRVEELEKLIAEAHNYIFVGRVGRFCPIRPGCGGGLLVVQRDEKYVSAAGAKGYRWLESEMVMELGKEDTIDRSYYDKLVDDAVDTISKYGDFEWFVSDEDISVPPFDMSDNNSSIPFNPDEPFVDEMVPFDVR